MTFITAPHYDGITAPVVYDQPINGAWFVAYGEQVFVSTLTPGNVVVMDNLGSHKGKAVRQAIRKAGAHLLLLPPYSPDLNPIKEVLAKLKTLLRTIGILPPHSLFIPYSGEASLRRRAGWAGRGHCLRQ